jgi:hypothetical protein
MEQDYKIKDLDLKKAREYKYSQNPNNCLRFILPIPNWLDIERPKIDDDPIKILKKDEGPLVRFTFMNYKDKAEQGVRIDGSAAIIFMGFNLDKAAALKSLIYEYIDHPIELKPDQLTAILERSYEELNITDRYNKTLNHLKYYRPYDVKGELGLYLPKENPSSAIYIRGKGCFLDGPTLTPQKFDDGAFINFPGRRLDELFKNPAGGKLVQGTVFINDRLNIDGSKIDLKMLP